MKIPTTLQGPEDADTVFVVHEVRSSWVGVRRRVIGVFKTRAEAERKAAETRLSLEGFIERHGGARCGDEKCGGSLLRYWIAGAPQVILGLAVEVEEANFRR